MSWLKFHFHKPSQCWFRSEYADLFLVQVRQPRYIGYYLSIELIASNRAKNLRVNGLVRFGTSDFTCQNDIIFSRKNTLIPAFFRNPTVPSKFQYTWVYTLNVILIFQARIGKLSFLISNAEILRSTENSEPRKNLEFALKNRKFDAPL